MQTSPESRDLLLRLSAVPEQATAGKPDLLTVEIEAMADHRTVYPAVRFVLDAGRLRAAQAHPDSEYGRYLGERLNSCRPVQLALAAAVRAARARVQIQIDRDFTPAVLSAIRWERLEFPDFRQGPLGVRLDTPLSRFAAVNRGEEEPPEDEPFHLLAVVSSPTDPQIPRIAAEEEFEALLDACDRLIANGWMRLTLAPGAQGLTPQFRSAHARTRVEFLEGPSTFDAIQGWLDKAATDVHGLHVIAHGSYDSAQRQFNLLLEAEGDDWSPALDKDLIRSWQNFRLRLVFLQSCQGAVGAGDPNDPRAGVQSFMQQLLEAGIPGVLAMQDRILMPDAREFNRGFYTSLVRNGLADEAANAGRALLLRSPVGGWSIPAFATRFVEGALWRTSPLRQAQQRLALKIVADRERRQERDFPIQVVSVTREMLLQRAIEDLAAVPHDSSAPLDAVEALANAAKAPEGGHFTCLVGARGRSKSPLLAALAQSETQRFLEGEQPAAPLMFQLTDCLRETHDPENTVALAIARYYRENTGAALDPQKLLPMFATAPYLFLVNGDDITDSAVARGVKLLADFLDSCRPPDRPRTQSRLIITLDESAICVKDLPEGSQCLVVRPMTAERVRRYLNDEASTAAEHKLLEVLEDGALFDLAEVPWLLSEMLSQARRGVMSQAGHPPTRATILGRVVRDAMLRFTAPAGMARLEEALEELAWLIRNRRDAILPMAQVFEMLARLRGNRDYPLFEFLDTAIRDCQLVRMCGDGIGFNYPGFLSYFSAAYLARQADEDRRFLLEDITAQLGRQSRADRWCETLFVLAGLWENTPALLGTILSGSHLLDGDQILIAARCLQEARLAFGGKPDSSDPLVRSIVGSLIRKARPLSMAPIAARKKALAFLGPLREREAIPELIPIAVDKVRPDKNGQLCYDYSGVRLAAIKTLLYQPDVVLQEIERNPRWASAPGLKRALNAWLKQDRDQLAGVLDDPQNGAACGVAAFALGITCLNGAFDLLAERLLGGGKDQDTMWAIADSLLETGSPKLAPFIARSLDSEAARPYITYLIGKSKIAGLGSAEWRYLRNNFETGDWALKGRSVQALAELGDETVLKTCHDWLKNESTSVRYYALQALRHIGTKESLHEIERVRWLAPDANAANNAIYLENLRIEVYEDIYWRLAGGLSRETMAPLKDAGNRKSLPAGTT